jgi:hypothetical protein
MPEPFASVEAAWFWTAASLRAGRDRAAAGPSAAPCRAQDVVKCLDTLYRRRRIELLHARILRIWGLRGVAPNPARPRERSDWRIWREALDRLEGPLRARGIVGQTHAPEPLGDECRSALQVFVPGATVPLDQGDRGGWAP